MLFTEINDDDNDDDDDDDVNECSSEITVTSNSRYYAVLYINVTHTYR